MSENLNTTPEQIDQIKNSEIFRFEQGSDTQEYAEKHTQLVHELSQSTIDSSDRLFSDIVNKEHPDPSNVEDASIELNSINDQVRQLEIETVSAISAIESSSPSNEAQRLEQNEASEQARQRMERYGVDTSTEDWVGIHREIQRNMEEAFSEGKNPDPRGVIENWRKGHKPQDNTPKIERNPVSPAAPTSETQPQSSEEDEENPQENTPTSEPPQNNQEADRKIENEENTVDVNAWLKGIRIEELDPTLASLFQRALAEKNKENPDQSLIEIANLVEKLPMVMGEASAKIKELSNNKERFSKIKQKQIDIIRGFCAPVINGHLTCEDLLDLAKKIEINSGDTNKAHNAVQGYDGAMSYCNGAIYIMENTLADNYIQDGKALDLDIERMIVHELSHPVVEAVLKEDKVLLERCNEIIQGAEELRDSQSMHIRTVLDSLQPHILERDFEAIFQQNQAILDEYNALPNEQQKIEFKTRYRNAFVEKRKQIAVTEILTEYTANYLKSDGKYSSFVLRCLESAYTNDPEKAFGISKEILDQLRSSNAEQLDPQIEKLMKENPKFKKVTDIYKSFYEQIDNAVTTSKGKGKFDKSDEGEDGDLFSDPPQGFDKNQQGKGSEGYAALLAKLASDMADEVNILKGVTG